MVAAGLWAPPGAVPVAGEDAEELVRRITELAGPDAPTVPGVNKLFDDYHHRERQTPTLLDAGPVGAMPGWPTSPRQRPSSTGHAIAFLV